MDELENFLNDFYRKNAPYVQLTPERKDAIVAKYGDDWETLIRDLYSKYAPDRLSDDWVVAVQGKYFPKKKRSFRIGRWRITIENHSSKNSRRT